MTMYNVINNVLAMYVATACYSVGDYTTTVKLFKMKMIKVIVIYTHHCHVSYSYSHTIWLHLSFLKTKQSYNYT